MPDLETLKIKIEAESSSVTAKLNALSKAVTKLKNESAPMTASAYKASQGLKNMGASARTTASALKPLKGTLGAVRTSTIALVAVTVKLGHSLASCVKNSMDFVETMNLFNVSMGDNAIAAGEFAEKVQQAFGIDMAEWMRNQGVFQTLIEGFGVASEKADIMSQQVTQLGYDLSSLFNLPFAESMQKLQSGIAGELEPLRRLGFDLSQAKLQQIAYDHGIKQTVQTMTQAQKVQLRYYAIMTQVTTAHGDMARTILQPANMLRVFKENVVIASRSIGNLLIPVMQKFLSVAVVVARGIATVANAIASLLGIDSTDWRNFVDDLDYSGDTFDDIESGIDDVGSASGRATKKIKEFKKQFLGFDKINNITLPDPYTGTSGGGGGGSTGGGGDLDLPLPTYDFLQGIEDAFAQAHPRIQKLFDDLAKDFEEGGGNAGRILGNALKDALLEIHWDEVKESGNTAASKLADGINDFIETPDLFATIGTTLAQSLNTVFGVAKTFADEFHWDSLGEAIADTINSFFEGWDLELTAEAISSWTTGILDAAIAAVSGVDWETVGKKITEFLSGIEIGEIAIKILKLTGTVVEAGGKFLEGLTEGALELAIDIVANGIDAALDWIWKVVTGDETAEFPIKLKMFDANSEAWAKLFLWFAKIGTAASTMGITAALAVVAEGPGVKIADLFAKDEDVTKDATVNAKEGTIAPRVGPLVDSSKITKDATVNGKKGTIDATIGKVLESNVISKDATVNAKKGTVDSVVGPVLGTSDIKKTSYVDILKGGGSNSEAVKALNGEEEKKTAAVDLKQAGWLTVAGWIKAYNKDNAMANVALQRSSAWGDTSVAGYIDKKWNNKSVVVDAEAEFTTWDKSKDFSNKVTGLTAYYNWWKKGDKFNSNVTGLTAQYKKWETGDKFGFVIGGITAKYNAWKTGKKFSYTISDMVAKFTNTKTSALSASDKVISMTAKITKLDWNGNDAQLEGLLVKNPKAEGGLFKNGKWRSITAAAGGGAFSTGQMFIAREAGPELVGRIGRSTAVMNNNQIVSSVAAGVASANAQQNSILSQILSAVQSGDAQVILQVDSTKLGEASIRSINKVQRMNGRVMLTV